MVTEASAKGLAPDELKTGLDFVMSYGSDKKLYRQFATEALRLMIEKGTIRGVQPDARVEDIFKPQLKKYCEVIEKVLANEIVPVEDLQETRTFFSEVGRVTLILAGNLHEQINRSRRW